MYKINLLMYSHDLLKFPTKSYSSQFSRTPLIRIRISRAYDLPGETLILD
jgi:hypothetical protein